jgi:hypothetical protein
MEITLLSKSSQTALDAVSELRWNRQTDHHRPHPHLHFLAVAAAAEVVHSGSSASLAFQCCQGVVVSLEAYLQASSPPNRAEQMCWDWWILSAEDDRYAQIRYHYRRRCFCP